MFLHRIALAWNSAYSRLKQQEGTMFAIISIGLVIVVGVALLRALVGSPQRPAQPQIIVVQAVPQQQQESGGIGALLLLFFAIIAAISFFPA